MAADAAGKSTTSYLSNLKGAYAEDLAKQDIVGNAVKDLSHVNKGRLDYVAKNGNVLDIVEAKARQSLSKKDIKNYIKTDSNGVLKKFNVKYSVNELGEDYLKDKSVQKRFLLYLNGPNSQTIKNSLNLPASVPYKFKSKDIKTEGQIFEGTVEIVIKAVNK